MADIQPLSATRQKVATLYSPAVGLIYLFNLIVGTGALAIPKAFGEAGWLISLIVIGLLAFFSFMTTTFVIETMAGINAVKHCARVQAQRRMSDDLVLLNAAEVTNTSNRYDGVGVADSQPASTDVSYDTRPGSVVLDADSRPLSAAASVASLDGNAETTPLLTASSGSPVRQNGLRHNAFEINDTVEMGEMATVLFNKVGITVFYICIIIYLYGDLAIYAVAVPKSLRDVVCTMNNSVIMNGTPSDLCWSTSNLLRTDVYRIFVAAFTVLLGPFVFFNLQKTMYLQIFTSVLRWTSFLIMIILTIIRLSSSGGDGHPPVAEFNGMTNLFGVCVYAFMCHHSLPQMATPIRNKSAIFRLFAADYVLIMSFYILICFTAVFTFAEINDLYTLNFGPTAAATSSNPITRVVVIQYFLALFPVFTLSSSFPIIAITLRNNLKTLFMLCRRGGEAYWWPVERLGFPLLTLIVPVVIALCTENVQMLVGITGSYAGSAIQYILPASFVLLVRRLVYRTPGVATITNPYQSPFSHRAWCIGIFLWAAVCVAFVTANHIVAVLRMKPINS